MTVTERLTVTLTVTLAVPTTVAVAVAVAGVALIRWAMTTICIRRNCCSSRSSIRTGTCNSVFTAPDLTNVTVAVTTTPVGTSTHPSAQPSARTRHDSSVRTSVDVDTSSAIINSFMISIDAVSSSGSRNGRRAGGAGGAECSENLAPQKTSPGLHPLLPLPLLLLRCQP